MCNKSNEASPHETTVMHRTTVIADLSVITCTQLICEGVPVIITLAEILYCVELAKKQA